MFKLSLITGLALISGTAWVTSFTNHEKFASLEIKAELVPDFLVTYHCDEYESMKDIHMVDNKSTVTVNYGGFGRRRPGKFVCLD